MRLRSILTACVILALTTPAGAQDFRGAIEGRVVDDSGGLLPGVTVTVTQPATGIRSVTVTNAEGHYLMPLLPPGIYRVSAELSGFRRVERDNVQVRVEDRVTVNITLAVGNMAETITVTANTPVLEAGTGSAGQVIDEKRIELMPLSDGNPFVLTRLSAGIIPFGDLRYFRPFDNNATAEFSASGAPTSNAYTIDGAPNQAHRQGNADSRMAFTPPASAVQEFKVETVTFDAQHGRAGGATVNVAMKSGTNAFKGEAYEYYRDEGLAENDFFLERRGQPEPTLDYNRYGFAGGGPVRRNRTFFFSAVEWLKDKFPNASQRTVPTMKQRDGDFSELLSQGIIIYDPATAFVNSAGRVERLPFPGNIIPPNRINPVARAYLKYYPEPNQPGDAQQRVNYLSTATRNDDFYTVNFRVDHQLTGAQKVFGRYSHNNRVETSGHWPGEVNGIRPVGFYNWRINDSLGLDYTWTTGAASVFNVRGSWGRFDEFDKRQSQDAFDPASLGFAPQTAALFGNYRYLPQFDLNRYDDLGSNWLGGITTNNYSVQPTWTKLTGRHSIRTGYDLRITREDERLDGHPAGFYQFRENYTRQSETSASLHGQDLAALLLGIPTSGRIERFGDRFNQVVYHGLFVQDDWRVSNRLTLNLGLRYEYEGAPTERFDRNVRGFDPDAMLALTAPAEAAYAANPIAEVPASAFRVRGGVQFTDERNRGFWNADRNNLQPRLGAAYRLDDKTVLRGGWAIYTVPAVVHGVLLLGSSQSTPLVITLDQGRTFETSLTNPFPNGALDPVGTSAGVNTNVGQDIGRLYNDVNFRNGQAMRWVATYQREFAPRWIAEASYVGTYAYDLRTDIELNPIPTQYLSRSALRDDATNGNLTATVPNPFRNLLPGTNLNGATVQRQQLLRPFPQFTSIDGRGFDGSSRAHSLQLKLDRRFGNGYSFLTTYTFTRSRERVTRLNEGDTEYEDRPARTDVPHRLVVNPIWELPFGRGRSFGRNARGIAEALIGGWSVALIYQYQSGEPLTLGNEYFDGDLRSLRTNISTSTVDGAVFDTRGFFLDDELVQTNGVADPAKQRADRRIQLASNYRTLPSRIPGFSGSPLKYWDVSVVKRLPLAGRVRAHVHLELYNASNFVWLRNPNVDPQNADFARVTSQGNLPRNIQIGAKIAF